MSASIHAHNEPEENVPPGLYPIRTVSSLTGVNSVTLRAWERRYGLIKPTRTPKGHRLYSDDDINAIKRILELLDDGVAVSQVSHALAAKPTSTDHANYDVSALSGWGDFREQLEQAVHQFNLNRCDAILSELWSLYPADLVTRSLLRPMLNDWLEREQSLVSASAERQFVEQLFINKLSARLFRDGTQTGDEHVVVACLNQPGCALEALTLTWELGLARYRPVYMGCRASLDALATVAQRLSAKALVVYVDPTAPPSQTALMALAHGAQARVWVNLDEITVEDSKQVYALAERADDSIRAMQS